MSDKRDPEAGDLGAQDGSAANLNVAASLPTPDDIDIVHAPVDVFLAFLAGYRTGLAHGSQAEAERQEQLDAEVYRRAVGVVRAMAELPSHDELEARRRSRGRSA